MTTKVDVGIRELEVFLRMLVQELLLECMGWRKGRRREVGRNEEEGIYREMLYKPIARKMPLQTWYIEGFQE